MRINHNIAALNTYRQLATNNASGAKSLEKLSSGLRINRAGDDAAGLAISEKMRGQIRGLDQASRNAQDGISLIQTAEGALNETHSILQRMRELAVQGSNDTNTSQDRINIQDEMDQLNKEIDRIAESTQFNTKNLLDGSMGKGVTTAAANIVENTALATLTAGATLFSALADKDGNALGIGATDTITVSWMRNGTTTSNSTLTSASSITALGTLVGAAVTDAPTSGAAVGLTSSTTGFGGALNGLTITVKDSNGVIKADATNALSSFFETTAAADVRSDGQATFQIGANSNQSMSLSIENMSSAALGVAGLKVGNQGQSNVAIKVLDAATAKVSSMRSSLGAVQNRLEHTVNNLGTSSENLSAAESRVRDVDMAKEMMEYTKTSILTQAATAMLAQANQAPQGVLQLLQ